jgi:hypothetical protein
MLVATTALVCGLCAHFLAMTGPLPRSRAVLPFAQAPRASVEDAADKAEAGEMPARKEPDGMRDGIATVVFDWQCGRLRSPRFCYAAD